MGQIAILDSVEYEYCPLKRPQYEYEKKYKQCDEPKSLSVLSWFFESWSPATSVTTGFVQ